MIYCPGFILANHHRFNAQQPTKLGNFPADVPHAYCVIMCWPITNLTLLFQFFSPFLVQ